MKRRVMAILTSLLMLAVFTFSMSNVARAAVVINSGTCGKNLTWILDGEGTLTITGSGAMKDYGVGQNNEAPWCDNRFVIKTVVIDEGATSIGDYAFYGCVNLKDITIPNSVGYIGSDTFQDCVSLASVKIPGGVNYISPYAFERNTQLLKGELADPYSGRCGSNLTWTINSAGILTISGTGQMWNYRQYSEPWYRFQEDLKGVVIQSGVTSIGDAAFAGYMDLTSITIPDTVTSIGDWAFSYCEGMPNIVIPNSVTSLGDGAFNACKSLKSVTVSDTVTSIGVGAFDDCYSLTKIDVNLKNDFYCSVDGVLYDKPLKTLIRYPAGRADVAYSIPEGVTSIGKAAFDDCFKLTSVIIPDSVNSIGDWSFCGCIKLSSVVIPESVTSIGEHAFTDCRSLPTITLPDSVVDIGSWAFSSCSSLSSITLPKYVTSIGSYMFAWCNNLKSITIPDTVTSIGEEAFSCCTSLTNITIPQSVEGIDRYAFSDCISLSSISIPDGVTRIYAGTFDGCVSLTSITIPNSVIYVEVSAFKGCTGLMQIVFTGNAPVVDYDVFENVTTTAYYPAGNDTWTADVMQNYGGNITWVAVEPTLEDKLENLTMKGAPVEEIRETVQGIDTEELKQSLEQNAAVTESIAKLEQNAGGAAKVELAENVKGISASEVTVIGANLNDVTEGKTAVLVISEAEKANPLPEKYDAENAIHFSMTLENVENTEQLEVPVKITLPIPEDMNPESVVIVHYHDDSVDVLKPVLQQENGKYYGSIVLSGFSDFAITQININRPTVDMFRMYDPNSGEHFYTGSAEERDNLVAAGWDYEGVGFTFPLTTGDPVYRLYEPITGEHLYTMDETHKANLMAAGWDYEGIAFNSAYDVEVPQYRLHNPNATRGAYHFTASQKEADYLVSIGWEFQGIGWYSCGVIPE